MLEDYREASLRTENESFWEWTLPRRELFSWRMSPSSYLTLGLHSMVRDSLLLKRSETVEVTSSLRMSNYISNKYQYVGWVLSLLCLFV